LLELEPSWGFLVKIAIIVPNVEMPAELLENRLTFLKRHAHPRTEITMIKLQHGPISIESSVEHEMAGYYMVEKLLEMEHSGYDAFIMWCGEDAGVVSAREVTDLPVVGPFEASCAMALTLGHKFSVLGAMAQKAFMERKVWSLGLGAKLASIRSLGVSVIQVQRDRDYVKQVLEERCEKAVREDGADVLILSCMALLGMAGELKGRISAPIVDPGLAALKMAETLVGMGLTHSKRSFPFPPKMPHRH
jgi:allantoin racemase